VILFVLSAASVSYAVIDMNPASFRTTPEGQTPTTYQSWDFSVEEDLESDTDYNTYGTAVATVTIDDLHHNSYENFQGVWELNGGMQIVIPNDQEQNSLKDIWLQITYLGSTPDISVTPDGGSVLDLILVDDPEPLFGGWHQATYEVDISPIHDVEYIYITPTDSALYIDGMIIETNCAPEPASLLMMSIGVMIIRGRSRRKKVLSI
jgi:hypothetical protein